MGWLSGAWCGKARNVRIEMLDGSRARFAVYDPPLGRGSSFHMSVRHLRWNGETIEAWAPQTRYSLWKLHKEAGGGLRLTAYAFYEAGTMDPAVPFSGTEKTESTANFPFHRCNTGPR